MNLRTEQIERIEKYETIMRDVERMIKAESKEDAKALEGKIRALEEYFESDLWKKDFADDEAGLLPKDLKRGVLSEDGVYDLLEACKERRRSMSRLKELRKYVDSEINKMVDVDKRTSAIAHLYGVSLAATMIAKKRGMDPEIASMAAMLHDLHAYKTGSYDDHAHKGAELAREILGELKLTDEAETEMICSAIYHHDDKLVVDGPMDEVLKDADVIHHCMNDMSKEIKEKEQARFESLCKEFGM